MSKFTNKDLKNLRKLNNHAEKVLRRSRKAAKILGAKLNK